MSLTVAGHTSNLTVIRTDSTANKRNNIFLELGGPAGIYSVNYERISSFSPNNKLSLRAGVGALGDIGTAIPISFSCFKNKKHSFEYGIGACFILEFMEESNLNAILGYRLMKKRFMFRSVLTPLYIPDGFFPLIPYAGISFGYLF